MGIKLKSLGVILSIIIGLLPNLVAAEQPPRVLITEVKIGGQVAGQPTEFLIIYNDSEQTLPLEGWTIEYAKPAAKITDCQAAHWKQQDSSANIKEVALSGTIAPYQNLIVELAMNDNAGGSLRLSDSQTVWDVVGWGNSVSQGACKEGEPAPIPANTKSIKRFITQDGQVVDTNNNKADFTDAESNIIDIQSPDGDEPLDTNDVCLNLDGVQSVVPVGYEVSNGNCVQLSQQPGEICIGVIISEILPNPAGTDTGNEYIELSNTTSQPIDLAGCSIKVGNTTKQLNGTIAPGYQAFYGVVLPNADGGTVEFITNTTEEAVAYPPNLKDNQAWAFVNGQWQLTEQPTPGAENIVVVTVEEAITVTTTALEPCPEGKYRNPETNRCKTIETEEGLKPCEPGQIRNPETNRCKKAAETLTSLKPCDADQERNPETNRCRKIAAEATLAACKEGQERNPETNRCRKVAAATTSSPSSALEQEVKNKQNISYGIFAVMAVLVLGYGIYEYRANIANFFAKIKK